MLNPLVVISWLVVTVSILLQGTTANIVGSLRLDQEVLAPYITSGYEVYLEDAIELQCPDNLTGTYGFYHLFEDQFDNCSQPEGRNYLVADCVSGSKFFLFLKQIQSSLDNIPQYEKGRKYYYGLYNSSLNNELCLSGLKLAVSIIDPNATSTTTPAPATTQLFDSNSTTASTLPVTSNTPTTSSRATQVITSDSTQAADTRPPSIGGIVNSSPMLRVSVYIVTILMTIITALLL